MNFYEGKRLSLDGHLCTVRYIGGLDGTQGEWLGVEWDDPSRGKHDGVYKGTRIFRCLSTSPTSSSFIRPTRGFGSPKTVLEAIKYKYEQSVQTNGSLRGPGYDIIEISKKKVEEVGFDKIKQQMSKLDNLKIVLLDQLGVSGLCSVDSGPDGIRSAQAELAVTCPNIVELDIGWNPIETWQGVLDVCSPLPVLKVLKASGLRFRNVVATQCLPHITELQLNDCLLTPTQALKLLTFESESTLPNLSTLWLSQNEISSFDPGDDLGSFSSITSLILENNKFTSLAALRGIFKHFPSTQTLSMQGNAISSADTTNCLSSTIISLNLSANSISDFAFIDILSTLFPNLASLRISRNPLYEHLQKNPPSTTSNPTEPHPASPTKASDAPFYLILARIPNLKTLNYTTITPRDREEGEIYYLSLADKEIRSTLSLQSHPTDIPTLEARYALYTTLAAKYDRPNLLTLDPTALAAIAQPAPADIDFATNASLAVRLIKATFYLPSPTNHDTTTTPSSTTIPSERPTYTRSIPRTTSVYTLKALLSHHFSLPPLQFRLIYESPELDPEQVTTTKLWGSSEAEWEAWGEWDVDVPDPAIAGADDSEGGSLGKEKEDEGRWLEDGVLLKDGVRWRRREVEILDGFRGWGEYVDGEAREVRVRIEVFGTEGEVG